MFYLRVQIFKMVYGRQELHRSQELQELQEFRSCRMAARRRARYFILNRIRLGKVGALSSCALNSATPELLQLLQLLLLKQLQLRRVPGRFFVETDSQAQEPDSQRLASQPDPQ
jgi:hypothetical protein